MHFEDYVKDRTEAAIAETKAETKAEDIKLAFTMLRSAGNDEEKAVCMICETYGRTEEEIRMIIHEQQKPRNSQTD